MTENHQIIDLEGIFSPTDKQKHVKKLSQHKQYIRIAVRRITKIAGVNCFCNDNNHRQKIDNP